MKTARIALAIVAPLSLSCALCAEVAFTSPGLAPSRIDDQGKLVEDWGSVGVRLSGEGLTPVSAPQVKAVKLDGAIPAAQAASDYGPVALTLTAFRAPAWPSGLDLLTVRVVETAQRETTLQLALDLPDTVRLGAKTASLGGRMVLALPAGTKVNQELRDWGWADDAVALPGWARPAVDCDPAFRNIRAGLGGVPILYRFKVEPKAAATVLLGFCESHWGQAGQRPMVCRVEGAAPQEVDPIARWGQHQPGLLTFSAQDQNGDGQIEIAILPKLGAPDQNPILNAIWFFPPNTNPNPDQVLASRLNGVALRYVDVGGANDQPLHAGGKVEYALKLPPGGAQELNFLVACPGSSLAAWDKTAWTPAGLRQTAARVWREWKE